MEIILAGAVRLPVGRFGGALKDIHVADLGAEAVRQTLCRSGLEASSIEEVIIGNVLQAGAGLNPARQASISAGIGTDVPAYTVNKACGSGLKSVALAAQAIRAGDGDVFLTGGMESMSNTPFILNKARWGYSMGHGSLLDSMVHDGLSCSVSNMIHMGITAENISTRYGISREDQDAFALESQSRAARASAAGRFQDEIAPFTLPQRKSDSPIVFDTDEHIRTDSSHESLARLRPAFKQDGTVTAGNASGINDGAAMMAVVSEGRARELGIRPQALIRAYASSGVDPLYMGMGPVSAVKKVLQRAGLTLADIDLFEVNEAFAAQSLGVIRELGLDPGRVNVNGGAIAIGHPLGASGARILVTLIYEMQKRDVRRGIATLCIGGGQGIAMIIERP